MKRILCTLTLTLLLAVPAEAKQVWFRWNNYVVVDYRYVGKKLNPPLPRTGPWMVRFKTPVGLSSQQQANWIDWTTMNCFDRLGGEQFNYAVHLSGWVCVNPRKISR